MFVYLPAQPTLYGDLISKYEVQLRKISAYLSLYIALTGCFLLGAWFIWRSFNTLTYLLAERKLNASEITQSFVGRQSGFIAMAWTIIASLVLLILIVFAESYFSNGIAKGNLSRRIARIIGLLLIFIFVIDLTALSLKGWAVNWIYWFIMAAELGGGIGLVLYSRHSRANIG